MGWCIFPFSESASKSSLTSASVLQLSIIEVVLPFTSPVSGVMFLPFANLQPLAILMLHLDKLCKHSLLHDSWHRMLRKNYPYHFKFSINFNNWIQLAIYIIAYRQFNCIKLLNALNIILQNEVRISPLVLRFVPDVLDQNLPSIQYHIYL